MISIIVPVYNVEKYISKCIDSVINQTYINWELILINDGSKDNSGIICDEYAAKDKRIRVIHKNNGGVSRARNSGIELAKGEYICFIDSDDWIEQTYLSDFRINEFKCDFYFSGALYDTYGKVYSYKKYNEKFCRSKYEIRNDFFDQDLLSNGYPWGKLYRTQIIRENNLRFNENLTINEDHIFVFQYFLHINSLYITNAAGYHYTVFDNSGRKLSGKINSYTELKTASEHFNIIIDELKSKWDISDDKYNILYNSFVMSKRFSALRSLVLLKEKKYFKEELYFWENNSYITNNRKDKIILFIIQSKYIYLKYILTCTIYTIIQIYNKFKGKKNVFSDLKGRSNIINK